MRQSAVDRGLLLSSPNPTLQVKSLRQLQALSTLGKPASWLRRVLVMARGRVRQRQQRAANNAAEDFGALGVSRLFWGQVCPRALRWGIAALRRFLSARETLLTLNVVQT